MPILDFKELAPSRAKSPAGENFEGLIRELGKSLGLNPEWSGRGADQGRDLLFTENRKGVLGTYEIRWLVSCKDLANSGRSVTEQDAGSVTDKMKQHEAGGYLLATTTTASSGLKAMLDALHKRGEIEAVVWDRHELESLLLREENTHLVKRYLPTSYAALGRLSSLPQILDSLRALVPVPVYKKITTVIGTYNADETWLTGELIWPHDHQSAETINRAIEALLEKNDPVEATNVLRNGEIEFDAFEAMLTTLVSFRPEHARALCYAQIKVGDPSGRSLFSYMFYVDNYEPANDEQVALALHLTREDLHHLYAQEISVFISEDYTADPGKYEAWSDLDSLSSHTTISDVYTESVELTPNAKQCAIEFHATITIEVDLEYDGETGHSMSFPGRASGHIDANGTYLLAVTADTSSFYE
ncbi:restriction endonuclease [Mesorhizobium sp. NPDC059025]|uniref:pPIWI-associating nuclease domain-containing protein n=1 Tax=unclassified Mesorhizobium TaxID=325217 RepID=UPI0036BB6159